MELSITLILNFIKNLSVTKEEINPMQEVRRKHNRVLTINTDDSYIFCLFISGLSVPARISFLFSLSFNNLTSTSLTVLYFSGNVGSTLDVTTW